MKKIFDPVDASQCVLPNFVRHVFPSVGERGGNLDQTPRTREEASKEDEIQQRESAAREQGIEEGRESAREGFEARLQAERAGLQEALSAWENDRANYFQQAEAEVVNLALAITRKILEREVKMDTLLLRGAVKVALQRMESATEIRLQVRHEDLSGWQELLNTDNTFPIQPELAVDDGLAPGQCVLVTSLGSTDLGWESQLKELEQSFQDLMAIKPSDE